MDIRDRVIDLRRMKAGDLVPHPRNPRVHPMRQHAAVHAFLQRIGIADRLLGRLLPDGHVQLLDGHLRREDLPDTVWPVLITDLNDQEADEFILMLHKLAGLAEDDTVAMTSLIDRVSFDDDELQSIVDEIGLSLASVDDWNQEHDYHLDTTKDRTFVKLVIAIHHHRIIEQVLARAVESFDCDRGQAFMRICELAEPHLP